MIFSSLQYLIFLPIVVFLYWRTTGGARLAIVVLSSYIFYMSWLPVYGLLLFALTAFNFGIAFAIDKTRPATKDAEKSLLHNAIFTFGVLLNAGLLIYYKYANWLIEQVVNAYNLFITQMHAQPIFKIAASQPWDAPVYSVILPLGISFFTFEFVHYIVDVYKGDKPMRSFMEFAAFASFFPSQIAGPIKRYKQFTDTLRNPTPLTSAQFMEGSTLIVQGLFKKVAIADPLAFVVQAPFNATHLLSASDAWLAAVGFCIQVYCDFSGYTDMGRGSAMLLGIRLPENFKLPFLATDLSDFWRRWHVTLGNWLRDYIYVPLGGSRDGTLMHWRNLFITMVACGIWHGASWHYIVFGALQGIGLCVNSEWRSILQKHKKLKAICETVPGLVFSNFLVLLFTVITYSIFRSPDIPHSINLLTSIVNFQGQCTLLPLIDKIGVAYVGMAYFLFWLICDRLTKSEFLMSVVTALGLSQDGKTFASPLRYASWTAAFLLIMAAKPTDAIPFVYFQF